MEPKIPGAHHSSVVSKYLWKGKKCPSSSSVGLIYTNGTGKLFPLWIPPSVLLSFLTKLLLQFNWIIIAQSQLHFHHLKLTHNPFLLLMPPHSFRISLLSAKRNLDWGMGGGEGGKEYTFLVPLSYVSFPPLVTGTKKLVCSPLQPF